MSEYLSIISALSGFICLVLAVFLFSANTPRKLPNQFFGAFLILTAIDLSGWLVTGVEWRASWFEVFRSALGALQMPLFLGFITSTCYSDFKLKTWDVLHTLPFFFGLCLSLPGNQLFWGASGDTVQSVYITSTEAVFQLIISHIQYYLYILVAVIVLLKFKRVFQQHFADARSQVFVWLSQLVMVSIFAHTLLLIRHIAAFGDAKNLFQFLQAMGALVVLSFITWVTLKALMQPELFRGMDRTLLKASTKIQAAKSKKPKENVELQKLLTHMENNKPYLDPELTLHILADQLAFTSRELSELINTEMNTHFFDFVNRYRINEAKDILLNDRHKTILEVLYEVGFNSKSSFNTAFKKHAQTTPTDYRKASITHAAGLA